MNKMVALVLLCLAVAPVSAEPIEKHAIAFTLPVLNAPASASLTSSSANNISFADYHDKLVYIDFWASWCTPCLQSMPFLNQLRNREHARGFEVIAINIDTDPALARTFLQQHAIDYPAVYDEEGRIAKQLHITALPTALLVAPGGRMILVHRGFKPADQEFLQAVVDKELAAMN